MSNIEGCCNIHGNDWEWRSGGGSGAVGAVEVGERYKLWWINDYLTQKRCIILVYTHRTFIHVYIFTENILKTLSHQEFSISPLFEDMHIFKTIQTYFSFITSKRQCISWIYCSIQSISFSLGNVKYYLATNKSWLFILVTPLSNNLGGNKSTSQKEKGKSNCVLLILV